MSIRSEKREKITQLRSNVPIWRTCGAILLASAATIAPMETGSFDAFLHGTTTAGQLLVNELEGIFAIGGASFFLFARADRREANALESSLESTKLQEYQPGLTSIPRENLSFPQIAEPHGAIPPQDAAPPAHAAE